ncbi:MAG: hypothetical protein WBH84_04465 [Defluviitoga tunisiensis]|uniref:Uncharacterized protein n=1 Tax=Defluviitoga tunisiensis TaxID=1006576 RepID=A0A0C7NKU3_DEFTU|nr:hypothetical protein [Defluviitoga tunisiensis]MDD3601370.1 hypothetical protein [Defluviitoga tunisiensis]MDY0379735.1 hypothetical protein [Defluviitoga tunisiensis]CEP78526.1 hypothetical protein DTL3_1225 [Defluviitoga tunisiensis]HHV01125.1 hypothetical protein [Defluviitoga tunisiensis]HOB55637.1 hypothetical protein [Defluviitoga tunisiensis]
MWINFTEESKTAFLSEINGYDEELSKEMNDFLSTYDIDNQIVPIHFPLEFESDEDIDNFLLFIDNIKTIVEIKAYSILSEISLFDEESSEVDDGFPALFSEEKNGECYLTVFDWNIQELDDYSNKYDKNDETITPLRLSIFSD